MHGLLPLPGDLVWIRRRRWRVERARRDRHVVRLDVTARDRRLTFLSPFDRVVTRVRVPLPRRVRPQEALARLAALTARADDVRVPSAAVGADADILPHQLEPAMAMLAGQTRILIADEVGLGKTVQAGLIVAELVRRDAATRVLVLAPASLRDQWTEELAHRFRITCLPADRAGLDSLGRSVPFGDDPWRRAGVWIASADFLKQSHVADGLPRDPWDLVVIDEAHAVCGESDRYDLCHRLACQARHVLLLTATPHSGDESRFARLIGLGRIDPGDNGITVFRRTRASLGERPSRRVRWHRVGLSEPEARLLDGLRAFERTVIVRTRSADQALLLLSVFRKRALSTMAALSQSLSRRLAWLGEPGPDAALAWAQPSLSFDDENDDVDREEREGLTAQTGLGSLQERSWLRRLRALAEDASREESKVERLVSLIHRSTEPVVVFTEFRDSLDVVLRRLRFSRPVSVLHGGQDAAERRQHLRQFLDGTTSVLLATDVAGQGLNLQARARWVISLELPWNPARLEQRIGRVDRISQARSTHLTLLIARDEAESGLLAHLSRRIFTARRSFSDDALVGVVPPEDDVRAVLLRRGELSQPAPAVPMPPCRRWKRPALRAARTLMRRRALAATWRSPAGVAGGAVRTDRGRAPLLLPDGIRALLVFSVPILNALDAIVERRVAAIGIDVIATDRHRCRAIADAARPVVLAAVRRRLHIAARHLRAAASAAFARERALAESIRDEIAIEEAQPGLFDRREARAFEGWLAEEARVEAASRRRAIDYERGGHVRCGDPILEIVIARKR